MKKQFTFLVCLLLGAISLQAQKDQTVFGNGGIDFTGVWAGPINNISNFNESFDISNGGYVLFEFNKNFLIGWTGYGSESSLDDGSRAEIGGRDFLLGYAFNAYKPVHPIVYLQTGGGSLKINDGPKDQIFVAQPAIGLEANIFRWMKIGADVGYRFVSNVDTPGFTDSDLSSAYIGLRFKFGWSWD